MSQNGTTALTAAAMKGHSETVQLLIEAQADVKAVTKVRDRGSEGEISDQGRSGGEL